MISATSAAIAVAAFLLGSRSWEECTSINTISSRLGLRPKLVENTISLLGEAVRIVDDCILVSDPLDLAIAAIRLGASEKIIAEKLDWRMFEDYAAKALGEAGYNVYRNLKLYSPYRFQVDVLGVSANHGVVFECKHWKPQSTIPSRLKSIAKSHLERARKLALTWTRLGLPRPQRGALRLVPAILVLREHINSLVVDGVAIVPVSRLRGFIEELPSLAYDENIKVTIIE